MPASDQIEPRRAQIGARLGWGLCAVSLTLVALSLVYGAWAHSLLWTLAEWAPNAVWAVSFPVVGALIATHRPRNPIGWLFCAVGIFQGLIIATEAYSDYALRIATRHRPRGPPDELGCPMGLGAQCRAAGHLSAPAVPRRPTAVAPLAASSLAVGVLDRADLRTLRSPAVATASCG